MQSNDLLFPLLLIQVGNLGNVPVDIVPHTRKGDPNFSMYQLQLILRIAPLQIRDIFVMIEIMCYSCPVPLMDVLV